MKQAIFISTIVESLDLYQVPVLVANANRKEGEEIVRTMTQVEVIDRTLLYAQARKSIDVLIYHYSKGRDKKYKKLIFQACITGLLKAEKIYYEKLPEVGIMSYSVWFMRQEVLNLFGRLNSK